MAISVKEWGTLGEAVRDAILHFVKPLEKRLSELEHSALRDGGVYHPAKAYMPGVVVQFANALWVAKCDTAGVKPGTSSNWRLIMKRDDK